MLTASAFSALFLAHPPIIKIWYPFYHSLTVYPGLESDAGVVLKSETAFNNPVTEDLDLQVKYIVDYDSEPAEGKKKTDTQLITGLNYKF